VKMGPIRCPETSVNNYHTTPRNVPEERRSRLCFYYCLFYFVDMYFLITLHVVSQKKFSPQAFVRY
jgi:hypothetical protein